MREKVKRHRKELILDTAKALMNQENQEEKLAQNEKLAKLRASVSLAKQGMANRSINSRFWKKL